MNEKNPLVTICFLTYNYAHLLEKALTPLINQTYTNTQIIISNNQSTDNTEQVAKKITTKNPKVSYRYNIPNLKKEEFSDIAEKNIPTTKKIYDVVFNHCNTLLSSGQIMGDFIIFCHQDDLYQTDIVKREVEFLMQNPDIPAVFTLGTIINGDDKIIGKWKLPKELKDKNIHTFKEIFKAILNHGNTFLITPTLMVRKELFEKVGLFDDQGPFGGSDDLEMWLRILEKYPIGIINEPLINWRTDGRGKKYNQLRTGKADFFKVMDHYLIDKNYITLANKKDLRQYNYQKDFDNTLRAMNFLIKGETKEAKNIINNSFSWENFLAFFENIKILRIKVMVLKIILLIGINLGLGKPLAKILHKSV